MFEVADINNGQIYENLEITFNNIENTIFNKCTFKNIVFNNFNFKNIEFNNCILENTTFLTNYLKEIKINNLDLSRPISLIYRKNRTISKNENSFINYFKNYSYN